MLAEYRQLSTDRSARPIPLVDLEPLHGEVADELEQAWRRVSASRLFVGGPEVDSFEQAWAGYCGVRHCVGLANGTDALALTLQALGIGRGDEVIVPATTFVATAEAVILAGARPRFVDVDSESLLMTAESAASGLTSRTAAIVPVHLYGSVVDMEGIRRVARRAHIAVVEDAAQAHGGSWCGQKVGSMGDAGSFSFYPSKNLGALGDAGAVISNDPNLIDRIRTLANHGRSNNGWHDHALVGRNSRLDALQAASIVVKLSHLDRWNTSRREVAERYRDLLAAGCEIVTRPSPGRVHHLQVIRVAQRTYMRRALRARGIETGVHYPQALHLLEPYEQFCGEALETSEEASREVLSLPIFPHMSSSQVERVCESLQEVMGEFGAIRSA
jgi:dTDP-4-amino-4,6-dideoxygalactose transaminase